ncbi:MAG TPA: extracellular solute-binding protein, partial [Chloroflexota bacterium]|nr:extracellular solute-binding protein [Chloroflexota bacterium]
MLRRRFLAHGITTAAGAVSLAACGAGGSGSGSESAANAPKGVGTVEATLQWQGQLAQPAMEKLEQFLAPWNEKYPKVKIEYVAVGGNDVFKIEKILTLAAGGTPLDVIGKITFIQPVARGGAIRQLEPFIKRDKVDISGYNQGWLKTFGTLDGKLYSLPWGLGGNSIAFIYSPEALAEVGLKPPSQDWKNPWTWDQYRDYARRLTKKQGDQYQRVGTEGLGSQHYVIPMQYGGRWISDDMKTATCDSPEMIEAYTRHMELIHKDRTIASTPGTGFTGDNLAKFSAGQTAMSFIGGWQMGTFTDPARYKVPYTMATYPKAKYSTPDMDTMQVAVGNGNKFPEEAWAFAKWLLEDGRYANLEVR